MADGADPRRATGAPRRRGTPLRAGDGRTVALPRPRFGLGNLQPITDRFAPLLEDVVVGPDPALLADVVSRRRSGAGSQASSSAAPTVDGGARDPGSPARRLPPTGTELETRWATNESGQHLIVGIPSHRRQSLLSQASSSAAPSSHHPGAEGRIRVRQSVLYSDRPRHSRPRRLARAEASAVRSSELHRPVMDLPTFEALSLGDPSLSTPETAEMTTPETAEMTNFDYAPRAEQQEQTYVVNSSEVDREVIEEALSLSDPPLLTPQTETDGESTDDDCASFPTTGQTEFFFNRPKGLSLSMVLSTPLFITVPNVKEEGPKLYSDVDPKYVQRMVKEYLDARPCMNLRATSYNILAVEDPTDARAAELGTESRLPNVITEQTSVAAAHPRMVPTESRHEVSAEEIIPTGMAWMKEEVMLCFKKLIDINRDLAGLEDYHLDELQHQCFNVESYDKVYHHYNFTVRMKMPEADWKVKLYFAEVKEVFRKKYYLCYPLDPNENGQCYACKNQGMEDLRHPAIDLFEMGSPDASCNLWYTDDESDEETKVTRFESDSLDLGILFGS
ncbi:uncharacterized protein LOC8068356 isoform X2 [Sorghum bicolor]|uniref:DUF3615 domain-containing protein n=1 Tax=Sorghum bicolor TaxID=4558 RepID=C5Y7C3_SORBI|nr:uncharacterized protein LOC8068356 isoform X2 [Sorghum bicolor]EES10191.1 hypothetical protein SORBI_3005G202000 [Sorghum bicolor]|eukprot:XP_002451203.1 uncharacterized protein LOC8068356 isoform X2 [Sorghum bicolor]